MADIALRLGSDVLVVAGPTGTPLMAQGFPADTPLPLLNLTEPETVLDLLRLYRAVGADCGVTNTFGATSSLLAAHGLAGEAARINRAGVELAREAGFPHVLASVGPCGVAVEPGAGLAQLDDGGAGASPAVEWPEGFGAAVEQYAEQVADLASAAPDAILLETFTSLDDALAALLAARRTCDLPVIASMALVGPAAPDTADVARALARGGAAAVGVNCMAPMPTLDAVRAMRAACDLPLVARPSAGEPTTGRDGGPAWPLGPDDFAAAAPRLVGAGATLVGSCCGTGPAVTGAVYAAVGGLALPE